MSYTNSPNAILQSVMFNVKFTTLSLFWSVQKTMIYMIYMIVVAIIHLALGS